MMSQWPAPLGNGGQSEELLVNFDKARARRVLILPAWFDEANKLRRFTIDVMRALDAAGIDSFLPDLPGCNESLAPLESQTLDSWRAGAAAAAEAVGASEVLAIRAGALLVPSGLAALHFAALSGPKLLRGMIRARTLAAREAGLSESAESLMTAGREAGLVLGGWRIGGAMLRIGKRRDCCRRSRPCHHHRRSGRPRPVAARGTGRGCGAGTTPCRNYRRRWG